MRVPLQLLQDKDESKYLVSRLSRQLDNYQQFKYPQNSAGPTPGKTVLRIEKVKTRKVSGIFKLG